MGNNNSQLKINESTSNQLPTFNRRSSMEDFTTNDFIDRQHMHHFLKNSLFQGNFSAPIEEKLIQGGCKVLDVG